jgi:hypothetical protein
MAVGTQASTATINDSLSSLALSMRGLAEQIIDQALFIDNLGTAGLETLGFNSTDAATVLQMIGYMNTVAGVYYGTVQQGGSGGTGASDFNFNNALSSLWGGQ